MPLSDFFSSFLGKALLGLAATEGGSETYNDTLWHGGTFQGDDESGGAIQNSGNTDSAWSGGLSTLFAGDGPFASPSLPSKEPYDREIAYGKELRQFERDLLGEPKFKAEYEPWSLNAPPSLSENDTFGKRIQPPGTINRGVLLNIKPNPFLTGIRKIDPNYFTNDFLHGKYNKSIDL